MPDSIDRCPTTPPNTRVDSYGCSCDYTLSLSFEFGSATLTAVDKAALDELIAVLRNLPQVRGVIEGHTDSVGPEAYNQGLSERRANAVMNYLTTPASGTTSSPPSASASPAPSPATTPTKDAPPIAASSSRARTANEQVGGQRIALLRPAGWQIVTVEPQMKRAPPAGYPAGGAFQFRVESVRSLP